MRKKLEARAGAGFLSGAPESPVLPPWLPDLRLPSRPDLPAPRGAESSPLLPAPRGAESSPLLPAPPSFTPTICNAARTTSAVRCAAPATQPSASPPATIHAAKVSGRRISANASARLMPLAARARSRISACASARGLRCGSMISMPAVTEDLPAAESASAAESVLTVLAISPASPKRTKSAKPRSATRAAALSTRASPPSGRTIFFRRRAAAAASCSSASMRGL